MGTIKVQLNYLGTSIQISEIDDILKGEGKLNEFNRSMLSSFFDMPIEYLPRPYIERYAELSTPEMYHPVFPHNDVLLDRLFGPLKSAKRCYCLGEYLATIELCSHVGEMLAILIWKMTPIQYKGVPTSEDFESSIFGCSFERLGQDRRVHVLEGFEFINQEDMSRFMNLKGLRRKYFHLWSGDFSRMKEDSGQCFSTIMELIKEILQVGIDYEKRGIVTMNPLLLRYIEQHASGA